MSLNRRSFTFASLSVLTLGSLAHASESSVLARWTILPKDDRLMITLHLKNTSDKPLTIMTHRGLRPGPKIKVWKLNGTEREEIVYDALTPAEQQESKQRGLPQAKWKSIAVNEEAKICLFRMAATKEAAQADIAITAEVKSSTGTIELPEQIISSEV